MQFIKKNWFAILVIAGLGLVIWNQYNEKKKAQAALKGGGAALPPLNNDYLPEANGYDASGIAAGI